MTQYSKTLLALALVAVTPLATAVPLKAGQLVAGIWEMAADEPPIAPDATAESVGESAEDAEVEGEPGATDAAVVPTEDEAAPLEGAATGVPLAAPEPKP